ncbi:MAG: PriCT-2 domain-containing protein [Acidobacteriota bacterium]|nr:PriCT-2 domain-containing protein [Acidobacteriota bacterium]
MWFGQKYFIEDNQKKPGKWYPYAHRRDAVNAGCEFISVLELCCSVGEYQAWQKNNPKGRLQVPFRGPFYADFDEPGELTHLKERLVEALWDIVDDFGLHEDHFQLWFSGSKGFHLLLPHGLFCHTAFAHRHLPSIYRDFAMALGLGELMDPAVYSEGKGRLWRVEGKLRENGCRKIPMSLAQLTKLTVNEIKRLSRTPHRIEAPPQQTVKPNKILCELFDQVVAMHERNRRAARKQKQERAQRATSARTTPREGWDDPDIEEIESLLADLPDPVVHEYGDWLRVGMALHHASEGEDWGLDLWHRWSQQSPKYQADVLDQKWPGFHDVEGGVTLGTLFHLARRTRRNPKSG